jgi:hypothetical protein
VLDQLLTNNWHFFSSLYLTYLRTVFREEYFELKGKWFNDIDLQGTTKFEEEKHRISKS